MSELTLPVPVNSTFSFSKYSGTAAAAVWTLGWAFTAICAIEYCRVPDNLFVPIAATLFGTFVTFRIFPREGRRIADAPDAEASPPESWGRRVGGYFALLGWCTIGLIWNLAIFSSTIRAATEGQSMTVVIMIPFSLIGGLFLLVLFTAIGMFLDYLFQIKDETAPWPDPRTAPGRVPPILGQVPPRPVAPASAPAISVKTTTGANDDLFKNSPILGTLVLIVFINWFVFFGISIYLGGDAIGTLPSQDGFILTSHGRHTAVSESTWVFSLYYSTATLLLSPAIVLLFAGIKFWPRRREGKWQIKLFAVAFIIVWSIGWYGSVGHGFLKSRADWRH